MTKRECLFCEIPAERVLFENAYAYAIREGFPVTEGRCLLIPKRHVADYFGLTPDQLLACDELIRRLSLQSSTRMLPWRDSTSEPTLAPLLAKRSSTATST